MAKATVWGLKYDHQNAIPSGPVAVGKLLFHMQGIRRQPEEVEKFHATPQGASLGQMKALAKRVGLELEMVFREAGAEIVAPAVIHLKQGHFAALIREENGRFLLDDPLLGGEVWMSRKALEEEASGYLLIPQAPLKAKWRKANPNEGDNVRGKCVYATGEPGCTGKICVPCGGGGSPPPGGCGGGGCGMAGYTFHTMLAGLSISDTPVGYSPPRGPSVGFEVTYNQKEAYQPLTFYYSNLGAKWSFDWISYLEDNSSSPGTGPIQLYARGGGRETYDNFVSRTSAPNLDTRAAVVLISSSPIKYERQLADGSVEVFAQPDGATTSPRRVFMTESKDPAGNKLTFSYDAQLRLVSVTDAINQVTTLSYELVADPLKIVSFRQACLTKLC
jgi:YD repeat-containing protein